MKKLLTIAVALSLAAFAAQAISHDISTGDLVITSGGDYTVTGTTTAYSITVDTADPVSITLDNVSIESSTTSPIFLKRGQTTITLVGDNELTTADVAYIGSPIRVPEGASLIIEGSGSLSAVCNDVQNPAIGNGKAPSSETRGSGGSIVIESGNIYAKGGYYNSGIGSTKEIHITINGGNIKADGNGFGAGIGGGPAYVTVTGGNIYAKGSKGAGIGGSDEGNGGVIAISGGTIYAKSDTGAAIGGGCGNSRNGDAPYVYISGGSVKLETNDGEIIGRGRDAAANGRAYHAPLTGENGEPVFKATVSGAVIDHSRNYTFTTQRNASPYAYSYSGCGYASGDVFSSNDDNLYFYLPNGEYVADGGWARFAGTVDNADAFLTKALIGTANLYIDNGDVTFTSLGVSGKDENGDAVEGEYAEYVVSGSGSETEHVIDVQSGSHNITLSGVNISGNPAINIEPGCNVTVNLSGENTLYAQELAVPARKSPFNVPSGANLTINGPGSLNSRSSDNWGAGIGGGDGEASGTITINSGSITAYGGSYSAGIGGGAGQYGTVTIKGGEVKAYGGNWGAGIGGGTGWNGYANVNISGGYIYGEGVQGAGIGNGDEGGHNTLGTITITGGTVEAKSGSGAGVGAGRGNTNGLSGRVPHIYISGGTVKGTSNEGDPIGKGWAAKTQGDPSIDPLTEPSGEVIYSATLPDAMVPPNGENFLIASASEEVDFTTKRDGEDYSYAYSGVGYASDDSLYFYLPDGTYVISGSNGKSFGGTIDGEDATFVVVPEPAVLGLLALVALCFRRK